MKTETDVKRILFYGDSLVFGKVSGANERLDAKSRFTGMIQDKLGDQYEIIENGLRGRTLVGDNLFFEDRDGLKQFGSVIGTQLPVDTIIILLGSNDANLKSRTSPEDISNALDEYLKKLSEWVSFLEVAMPEVVLAIPTPINEANYDEGAGKIFGPGANERLSAISAEIREWAGKNSVRVVDLSSVKPGSGDGVHLEESGNKEVAELLAKSLTS